MINFWMFGCAMFIIWVIQLLTWRRSWKINEYEGYYKLAANTRLFPFWYDEGMRVTDTGEILFNNWPAPDLNQFLTKEEALEAINKFSEWQINKEHNDKELMRIHRRKKTYKIIEQ